MKEENKKQSYKPTSGMKTEAQKGLDWRRELGRGATPVGIARARDIVNDKMLPIETVARMYSFFARHEVDKQAEGFRPGEKNYPSNGRIAWAVWGGDPGFRWSKRIWFKYKEENKNLNKCEDLFDENSSDEIVRAIIYGTSD